MTQSYRDLTGLLPDFEVRYRFLGPQEGGRTQPPQQHIHWNFVYEGQDPQRDGQYMIWPEFVDGAGTALPEGRVPADGLAHMFIFDPDLRDRVHRARMAVGVKGYFVEGSQRVADCQVTRLIGLAAPFGA